MKRGLLPLGLAVLTAVVSLPPLPAVENAPKPESGTVITIAGSGMRGFRGDGGPALQARFDHVDGLALDAAGTLYLADSFNNRVRKVDPAGIVSTVAGKGGDVYKVGPAGDNGPAQEAEVAAPYRAAVDGAGNLLFSEEHGHRIRKVSTDGIITTLAGTGKQGNSEDGILATKASLSYPFGVAVNVAGDLFIAEESRNRVRKVSPDGIISTYAGGGKPADGLGDDGPATMARLGSPVGLALDRDGNLFVTDQNGPRVRKVSADGMITTVAGGGRPADGNGDDGPATDAHLSGPANLAVDGEGNLFIAEQDGNRVRKVAADGKITTIFGGGTKAAAEAEGGPANQAKADGPSGLVVDANGNLLVGERSRVRKVIGAGSPGLIAGKPFPMPNHP